MAGEGDAERLVVLLEARIRDFEKNLQKASGTARRNYGDMRRGSQSATRQMESDMARASARINQALASTSRQIGSLASAFGAGFLGGISLTAVTRGLASMTKGIAEVGDAAKQAGLSAKAFQELKYVAEQNRIGVDSLVDGIKELNLRADEWISTGGGSAADAFKRLGYSASELKQKLRDPSALFTEIIGKLQKLDKAAQIRIADEVFGGTGGEKFVQLISQGEEGIRKTIRQADEIQRKFSLVSDTVSGWVQPKVIAFLNDVLGLLDRIKPLDQRMDGSLDADLAVYGRQRMEIENEILRLRDMERKGEKFADDGIIGNWGASTIGERIAELEREREALQENERRIMDVVKARQAENSAMAARRETTGGPARYSPGTLDLPGAVSQVPERRVDPYFQDAGASAGKAAAASFQDGLKRYLVKGQAASHVENLDNTFAERLSAFLKAAPGGGISIYSGARSFERQAQLFADAVKKYGSVDAARKWVAPPGSSMHNKGGAADLHFADAGARQWAHQNAGMYGLNFRMGHEPWHIEMLKDGESAQATIDGLNSSWEKLGATVADVSSLQAQQEAYQQLGQIGTTALRGLANALADGKLEGREVLQILVDIVEQLMNMPNLGALFGGSATGGGGFFGNLLGGLFGGGAPFVETGGGFAGLIGYAGGTNFAPGGPARINERGGEIVNLPRGAQVVPHDVSMEMARRTAELNSAAAGAPRTTSQAVHVTFGWEQGSNGNIEPAVRSVAQREAAAASRSAIDKYNRTQAPQTAMKAMFEYQQRYQR